MPCLKLPCFQELCSAWRGSSSSVSTQRTAILSNRPAATSHCIPSIPPRTLHSGCTLLGIKPHSQYVKDMMPRPHRNNCCWKGVVFFEERRLPSRTMFSFSSSNCSSGISRQSSLPATGTVGTMENAEKGRKPSGSQDPVLKEVEEALGSPLGVGPQAPLQRPLVMVVSGPSGVGKDAVIKRLQEVRKDIHFVITATTRPKRPGEIHGKDYFFVTKEQFETMIEKDELLEYAVVYGDYKGIPKGQVRECLTKGLDVVLRVDVQGAATVRSILGSGAVFIFLVAESEAALVKRLMERKTETRDKLLLRVATAREELKRMEEFDYVVVNADQELEKSVSTVCHIIDAEKARVHQREACL